MKIFFKTFLLLSAVMLGNLPAVQTAWSESRKLHVEIETALEPERAVAVFSFSGGTSQLPVQNVQRAANGSLVATVVFDDESIPRDAMVSVLLTDLHGKTAAGNMEPAFAPGNGESWLAIPPCAPEKLVDASMAAQVGSLDALVSIRTERRKLAQLKAANILSGEFLTRIQALEKAFGFQYPEPISATMNPVFLIDRLYRILEAVKTYDTSRKQPEQPAQQELSEEEARKLFE